MTDADVALFVIDAREGITPLDRHFAEWLRRSSKPVVLVANKAEGSGMRRRRSRPSSWGWASRSPSRPSMARAWPIFTRRLRLSPKDRPSPPSRRPRRGSRTKPLQLAIVGRPNVGKSTLVNRLIGEDRLLTGPEAGITRDAIAIAVALARPRGAAHRHRGLAPQGAKVEGKLEKLSVADTLSAIRFAETVVLVLDATQLLEKQDLTIARMVADEGRALVLAVNKWDLVEDRQKALGLLRDKVQASLPQLAGIGCVTLSAATGAGIDRLMPAVIAAHAAWNRRVPTPQLNRFLAEVQERHPPPLVAGRPLRLRYMTQVNIRPPSFALFASKPGELPESYRRYLTNLLRETFELPGVPIRMMLRKGKNPYAEGK